MNVAVKEPRLEVVIVVGEVGCVVPSYLIVTVEDAPNPVPVTLTLVPPTPFAGFRAIEGVTVKVACPEWNESVAVTVWGP